MVEEEISHEKNTDLIGSHDVRNSVGRGALYVVRAQLEQIFESGCYADRRCGLPFAGSNHFGFRCKIHPLASAHAATRSA